MTADNELSYGALLHALRCRRRVLPTTIDAVLREAGKTAADLVADLFGPDAAPQSGDDCPACEAGRLKVLNTVRVDRGVVQYLGCGSCGHRPPNNKRVLRP